MKGIKMNYKNFTELGLISEKRELNKCLELIKRMPKGCLTIKYNSKGRKQYYITSADSKKHIYANRKMLIMVYKLKQKKKAEARARILANNIAVREYVLENYQDCSDETIDGRLPAAYRNDNELNEKIFSQKSRGKQVPQSENPYKPEELRHITSFNLRVRSKGELITAEALYAGGFVFFYEKRLELYDEDGNIKVIYPDFTIIFPSGFIVYWEHKGRLDDREYVLHDMKKTQLYYNNGIFEPHNLIVTTDGPGGTTDVEAIHRIINGMLMPLNGI